MANPCSSDGSICMLKFTYNLSYIDTLDNLLDLQIYADDF